MKLYFVRHGQSQANLEIIHENDDGKTPLTAKGIEEARAVAERFRTIPIDVIFSSTYVRAKQTAYEISLVTGQEVTYSDSIIERRNPSEFRGKSIVDESILHIKRQIAYNQHQKDWHFSDEESYWELLNRAQEFIRMIEAQTAQNIIVVSHGTFIRAVLTCMMFGEKATPDHLDAAYHFYRTKNTGITMCEKTNMKGVVRSGPYWQLMTFNDYSHLGD
jgi:broad specificity phosphatase PhoE